MDNTAKQLATQKEIALHSLKLENFQGIKSFTLAPDNESVSIYGENGTGKTTLFNAFTWLLFSKDSLNQADFEIKSLDATGSASHGLNHSVEAKLYINGEPLTLKKVLSEKWVKKRGSTQKEFTGHTTDYFLNGVPVKQKEYNDKISEICEEGVFKLLTNPRHFNEVLHWQRRRSLLLEVCGDISDADVISSDSALSKLPEILHNRSLEDHRKIIMSRRTEINKEIEKVPVRIDEATRSIPDTGGANAGKLLVEIEKLKSELENKNAELARVQNGGELAEKVKQLRKIEAEIQKIQNRFESDKQKRIQAENSTLNKIQAEIDANDRIIKNAAADMVSNQNQIIEHDRKLQAFRDQWTSVDNTKFTFEQSDTCPTCGQSLPVEQLEEARKKSEEEFNLGKAETLKRISNDGKNLKARGESLKLQNDQLRIKAEEAEKANAGLIEKKVAIQDKITAIQAEVFSGQLPDKTEIEIEIARLKTGDNADIITGMQAEIKFFENQIEGCQIQIANIKQADATRARIEDLKAQEKKLAAEFEKLESELYLSELFIRSKVNLLESKINSKFDGVRFVLFNQNINGGIEETCETSINGVPYSSANNAAKINAGLSIINTLSDFYGIYAPIYIDNAEAVTQLIQTKSQMIKLIVSEKDKTLRVEA